MDAVLTPVHEIEPTFDGAGRRVGSLEWTWEMTNSEGTRLGRFGSATTAPLGMATAHVEGGSRLPNRPLDTRGRRLPLRVRYQGVTRVQANYRAALSCANHLEPPARAYRRLGKPGPPGRLTTSAADDHEKGVRCPGG